MDILFLFLALIAFFASAVFVVLMIVSFIKKQKPVAMKRLKIAGISFAVMIVSFIVVGATADTSEVADKDLVETSAPNIQKEETPEEKAAREAKEAEEKAAAEAKAKEEAEAKAKAEAEQKAKEEAEAAAKAAEESVPREHRAALAKAETYAEMMHMSKAGIYDQLTSEYGENFPPEAAQYAMDNLEWDWKDNALKKAQSYAEMMNMSDSAIYDQLISEYGEKFTPEEAQYAIDNL
ncbi:Ltp family lipoprotein [Chungangia koreensis]|uniref:Ltp family lipoprotein n=1 Tax=Chungangia koreensis TaxID=752657 RepID=A0ABV8X2T8_9LACT